MDWLSGQGEVERLEEWLVVLKPGSHLIEIGSGAGQLVAFLAENGFSCCATEMSDKRQADSVQNTGSVVWRNTDGVNLTDFERPESFDHVISDQVVEHLHPEDILVHLRTARDLLVDGGSYVLRTPHRSSGPHDLSRVFDFDVPVFMHLHEYTFDEIDTLARQAGYSKVEAIVAVPVPWRMERWVIASRGLVEYNKLYDRIEALILKSQRNRRTLRRLAKAIMISSSVWVRLRK
jgi:SAM-dependent methyltransferase